MKLSEQMLRRAAPTPEKSCTESIISTGSTLLDLAISGGVNPKGGLPGGILVEIFGPSSTGKTVLLSEIAGGIQARKGEVRFYDPEGRLNKQFAALFGLNVDEIEYGHPDTVAELFAPIKKWEPDPDKGPHGVFADSLAALTTDWEMDGTDQYGMRRAKEFSTELRQVCRMLVERNILMVCSNQIRQNIDAGTWGQKYKSPGGEAIGFYSSVRLRTSLLQKEKRKRKVRGKEHELITGVELEVEVFKNSVWAPYHKAPVFIRFDYGIDDVKANLRYIKQNTGASKYIVGDVDYGGSIEHAAADVEEDKAERKLQAEVIELWKEIEDAFATDRKKRR